MVYNYRFVKPFLPVATPKEKNYGHGWTKQLDTAWSNEHFVVMTRKIDTEWGIITHACIRNRDNTDIPWGEKQEIKNQIFGKESTAVEVFPADSQLVDEANMYHLWILPEGFKLPFNLKEG